MLNPARVIPALLLVLAGCASRQESGRAPDWQDTAFTQSAPGQGSRALAPGPKDVSGFRPPVVPTTPANPKDPPAARTTVGTPIQDNWTSLNSWCAANNLAAPLSISSTPQPVYLAALPGGNLLLKAGGQSITCRGIDIRLGFPPRLIENELFVHALDVKKSLDPLLPVAGSFRLSTPPVIVLDPGHGGQNGGTRSVVNGAVEKEYTLDWALRVKNLLTPLGWTVRLTRTNDVDLSLPERVAFADNCRADLFVSLHFNSAGERSGEAGVETYCLTPPGMTSAVTRDFPDDPTLAYPNNTFDAQNLALAFRVHRALSQVVGRDRGIRRARFLGVLRNQQRPSILVEGGYLSNPEEARLIATAEHRQKLAEAVARGLQICVGTDPRNTAQGPAAAPLEAGRAAGGRGL